MQSPPAHSYVPVFWFPVALLQEVSLRFLAPGLELGMAWPWCLLGALLLAVGVAAALRETRRNSSCPASRHTWATHSAYVAMLGGLIGGALLCSAVTAIVPVVGFASLVTAHFVSWDARHKVRLSARTS